VKNKESWIFLDICVLSLVPFVIRGDSGHDTNTQYLAMGLLARVLAASETKDKVGKLICSSQKKKNLSPETVKPV
jgi:hypothetical protein